MKELYTSTTYQCDHCNRTGPKEVIENHEKQHAFPKTIEGWKFDWKNDKYPTEVMVTYTDGTSRVLVDKRRDEAYYEMLMDIYNIVKNLLD